MQPVSPKNSTSDQRSAQKQCTSSTIVPHPAQRGGSAKSSARRAQVLMSSIAIHRLSRAPQHRTSAAVPELFDMELRALRRDRAKRLGLDLFLLERAFDDCLDRLSLIQRRFERALLIGCPDPRWRGRLGEFATTVDVRDPGALFARSARGEQIVEDAWEPEAQSYDVVLAVGTLDTINDLPRALIGIRWALTSDGLFLGAMSGGDTVPRLRSAMRVADAMSGAATPHIHPRIEASALGSLLSAAGFLNPVVDVDRVAVSYRSLQRLIADLRRMGATNILAQRSRKPLLRQAYAAAAQDFSAGGDGERTTETFEILHFAGWSRSE